MSEKTSLAEAYKAEPNLNTSAAKQGTDPSTDDAKCLFLYRHCSVFAQRYLSTPMAAYILLRLCSNLIIVCLSLIVFNSHYPIPYLCPALSLFLGLILSGLD